MDYIIDKLPVVLAAVPFTLFIALSVTAISLFFGIISALLVIHKTPILSRLTQINMAIIRGVPALILIYIAYYGIPKFILAFSRAFELGWSTNGIPNVVFAIVALSIERWVYMTEMVRGAVLSVDSGQLEATKSIGMTMLQSYRRIILPQAAVAAIPNFGNLFIGAIKGSSLAYVVGVMEVTAVANVEASQSYRYIELFVVISIIYWIMNATFERLFKLGERSLSRYKLHG